jgi:hypothetical protein
MNLYHYCSNAAFISIIENKQIWASEFSLSNDVMEGKWIREIFREYCQEKELASHSIEVLLTHLDFLISRSGAAGFCMSENGDLLSQWRAYADNGAGVSIGFSKEYLELLGKHRQSNNEMFNAHLQKIEYEPERQKAVIAEYMEPIIQLAVEGALSRSTLASLLNEEQENKLSEKRRALIGRFIFFYFVLYALKNPAFAEEQEWRIISHLLDGSSHDSFGNMSFRAKENCIVPYIPVSLENLSSAPIAEVILGPKNLTPERFVEAILRKNGWKVTVRHSRASYR